MVVLVFKPSEVAPMIKMRSCSLNTKVIWHFYKNCKNSSHHESETALDETLQRITDTDYPAIKPNENKALLEQIEKSYKNDLIKC